MCVCFHALLPCGEAIRADLFICSLICQTRSNAPVTLYRVCFSHCLHPSQTQISSRRQAQKRIVFLSLQHSQSCRCPPASQNLAVPLLMKSMNFMQQPAATSDYQVAGLYSPILINLNHLPEKQSQQDTQIHAHVCQTISTQPLQEHCLHISTTSQRTHPRTHTKRQWRWNCETKPMYTPNESQHIYKRFPSQSRQTFIHE